MDEELKVRFTADSRGFKKGIEESAESLRGLKKLAGGLGLTRAVKQAEKEMGLLNRTIEMNQRKLAEYQQKAAKLRLFIANPPGVNTAKEQTELDNLIAKLDNVNAQIEERKKKLAEMAASHTGPQGQSLPMGPKTTKEFLKTESELVRLTTQSDKTVASIAKLEDKIQSARMANPDVAKAKEDLSRTNDAILRLEKSTASAEKRARGLKEDLAQTGRSGKKAALGLKEAGKQAREMAAKTTKPFNGFAKALNQAIRRVLVLGVAYKLVRGATKYLTDALKTNRQFTDSLNAIKVNLATAFQPIYEAVLPALNALMATLAKIASYVAAFTSMLFGKTYSQSKQAAKGLDEAKKAMNGYGGAAEEAKGQLAAFDKFNDITPQQQTGGAEGMNFDAVGEPENLEMLESIFEKLNKLLEPTKKSLSGLWDELKTLQGFAWDGLKGFYDGFLVPVGRWVFGEGLPRFIDALTNGLAGVDWQRINDALANLWGALTPFAINIGEGLLWFWEKVLVPFGTWTMNEVVPAFLAILSAAITILNNVIDALKPFGEWLWISFLQPIAQWTGGVIVSVLGLIATGLTKIGDWIKNHQTAVETMAVIISSFATAWGLVNIAIGAWNTIGAIATGVTGAFGAAVAFLTSPIGIITVAIGALIAAVVLLVKHWDEVKAAAITVWEGIKSVWGEASTWFNGNVIVPIKNGFKEAINFLIGLAEGIANAFIKAINFIINAFNKISFSIPDWVPVIGGKSWGFNLPNVKEVALTRLAAGGLAYGELTALVGDNFNARQDPEVVSPLSRLQDMITGAILQRDIAGGGNEITIRMVTENGEPLVEMLIDPMNKTAKNLGFAPVFKPVGVV